MQESKVQARASSGLLLGTGRGRRCQSPGRFGNLFCGFQPLCNEVELIAPCLIAIGHADLSYICLPDVVALGPLLTVILPQELGLLLAETREQHERHNMDLCSHPSRPTALFKTQVPQAVHSLALAGRCNLPEKLLLCFRCPSEPGLRCHCWNRQSHPSGSRTHPGAHWTQLHAGTSSL